MAVVTQRWMEWDNGSIYLDLTYDDSGTTDNDIHGYSLVNNSTRSLHLAFYQDPARLWREATIGPGQSHSDTRPFPGGIKTLLDIPIIRAEVF